MRTINVIKISRTKIFSIHFFIRCVMLGIAIVIPLTTHSQKMDSLKQLLTNEFGYNRGIVLFDLAYYYTDNNNDVAMRYVDEATRIGYETGDSLLIVKCGRLKALLYRRFDKMDSSLSLSERILPIAQRHKYDYEQKKILNGLGLVYSFKSNYDKALVSYFRILDLINPDVHKKEASVIFNNIGLVYYKLNDFRKALIYYNKSLALKRAVKDSFDLDQAFVNISSCHAYLGDFKIAKEYNIQALDVCKTSCSPTLRARAYHNLGLIYYATKHNRQSKENFRKSYELSKKTNDERLQIDNLLQLLRLEIDTNGLEVNREILDDVERILDRGSFYIEGIMQLYAQLAEVYKKSGDIRKVAVFQNQYIALRDSIFNNQLIANLMKVEGDFVGRENKAKLESQHRILELSNDIINRQHTLNIVVGIVAVLLIALVVLLLQNIKVKKRTNLLLEIRVKERTIELQKNHDTLLKALQEKDIQVQRISSEIRSSMATINGLGVLVSHDIGTVSASTYLEKIQETSNNLIKGLNRLHDNNSWI